MKKYWILVIVLLVVWLAGTYQAQQKNEQGIQLVEDAYYGDLLSVKNALEQGAPLHYQVEIQDPERNYNGIVFNVLHAAASGGNEDLIVFLLNEGLDINTRTSEGWTPLFIAARDGQAEAAKLLIFKGADLNAQTSLGATALLMAVTQKFPSEKVRKELITYMLKRGADPTLKDAYHHTPDYYAEKQNRKDLVDLLKNFSAR